MSEPELIRVEPTCPQCGAGLQIEWDGVEAKSDDRVLCPVHGTIGTRAEVGRAAYEQSRDEIVEQARDVVRDAIRKTFGK